MGDGVTPEAVLACLGSVETPDGRPLPETGRLSAISVRRGRAVFSISVAPADAAGWEVTRREAERVAASLSGVTGATVVLTADRPTASVAAERSRALAETRGAAGGAPEASPAAPPEASPGAAKASGAATVATPAFPSLTQIGHIIAVASGKGGVGKSTTACNLALALAQQPRPGGGRLKVGVLDADIYGPSFPKLLALRGQPRILSGRTLEPMEAFGLKVMSIGFLVDPDKAMIWRGPMVASAITQMLRDVAWGALDVLVVDMPPGTGDAQLTLAQQARLAGAVIVSTPQDLALIDARRGVAMFRDVGVPILGLIENMSYFVCDGCGKRHHPFAHGGARTEAGKLGVPFLGEIALDPEIRERADAGQPIVVTEPDGEAAATYLGIAKVVWSKLSAAGGARP